MIFLITKFSHVWPILIFLPLIVIVFLRIKGHYKDIAKQLKSTAMVQDMPIVDKNLAIVPVSTITSAIDKSVYYAQMIADDVIAVHVSFGDEADKCFAEKWQRHYPDVRLVILHSEYRSVIRPISRFIDKINKKRMIKIMSLQLLCLSLLQKSWHNLHNQTSIRLKCTCSIKRMLF